MPGNWLNVPHYEQEFSYSCIPACVRMVLAYWGCSQSEDDLRQMLQTDPTGTIARNLSAVQSLGFDVRIEEATLPELEAAVAAQVPPLVFLSTGPLDYWNMTCDHVVVFLGVDAGVVHLNDPFLKVGPQQTSLSGFLQAWAFMDQFVALITPRP